MYVSDVGAKEKELQGDQSPKTLSSPKMQTGSGYVEFKSSFSLKDEL